MGYFSTSPAAAKLSSPSRDGLVARMGNGYERVVMSDQEICDDVLDTIPKLTAAASRDSYGRKWKQRKRKNGVDMFELIPGGGDDQDDDLDIAHALVAKTEIRCHLNEVLNVLIHQNSEDYEASMRSLCGKKFKRGQLLFQQNRKFNSRPRISKSSGNASRASVDKPENVSQQGLVGVQLMTIRPKIPVKLRAKHKRTQRLCFASCTQQFPGQDRAIHVMKTIPKDAHDQIIPSDDRTALRRRLDHLAVGFDIRSTHGEYSARSHVTRIFLHAYASTVPPSDYHPAPDDDTPKASFFASPDEIARQRKAIMNPEAHHVLNILTKSLREFETVIRRRRFGFQSYVYFPTTDVKAPESCYVCSKDFSLFRRDMFCQLCGASVCKDCSQMYEVEARVGEIRKNRCCVHCVSRVDSCVFDDEDLLSALGPVVVDADERAWDDDYPMLDDASSETDSIHSSIASLESISESLYSADPDARSFALERLAQLVRPERLESSPVARRSVKAPHVLHAVDNHLRESVRNAKNLYSADNCVVYDRERDYAYAFESNKSKTPLAPIPEPEKESSRLKYIDQAGVLNPNYDHAALDMLARLAAQHLNCPTGYVSVIGEKDQHIIGKYQYPDEGLVVPRDETLCMHGVYAETPMVLKNPRRDMRFAQLPIVKDLGFQFYAGFPIRAPDGSVVASLCAGDVAPHSNISTKDYATMQVLTSLAAELLVPNEPQPLQVEKTAIDTFLTEQRITAL